jgi:hypothetical protein
MLKDPESGNVRYLYHYGHSMCGKEECPKQVFSPFQEPGLGSCEIHSGFGVEKIKCLHPLEDPQDVRITGNAGCS